MPDPVGMIMPMPHEMREEMRQGFASVDRRFDGLDARPSAVETIVKALERRKYAGRA